MQIQYTIAQGSKKAFTSTKANDFNLPGKNFDVQARLITVLL